MVEISKSGSGEGPGWATASGYSTMAGLRRSGSQALAKVRPMPSQQHVEAPGGGLTNAHTLASGPDAVVE